MEVDNEIIRKALVDARKVALDNADKSTAKFIELLLKGRIPEESMLEDIDLDDMALWLEPYADRYSTANKILEFIEGLAGGLLD